MTSKSSYYYYLAFLNHFRGGCLEIDPSGITKDQEDVLIYHQGFPQTNNDVRLSVLLKLILVWVRYVTSNSSLIGPIILSIDNKKIRRYQDQQVIWKVLMQTLYHPRNKTIVVPYNQKIGVGEPTSH